MKNRFNAVITKEKGWYVAKCIELGVVSQGRSVAKAKDNLKEAVELYLESFGSKDIPDTNGEIIICPFEVKVMSR